MGNYISGTTPLRPVQNTSSEQSDSLINHISNMNDCIPDKYQPLNNFLIALYSYKSQTNTELDIRKGDIVYLLDGSNDEWCRVRSQEKGQIGYVPKNYLARFMILKSEE